MVKTTSPQQVQVNFRMPADLKARVEEAARANSRSTTAEIVATLEEKYPHVEPPPMDSMITQILLHLAFQSRKEELNDILLDFVATMTTAFAKDPQVIELSNVEALRARLAEAERGGETPFSREAIWRFIEAAGIPLVCHTEEDKADG